MNYKSPLRFAGLVLFAFWFGGCSTMSAGSLEPITNYQEQFVEIRRLHEAGESRQVLEKVGSFAQQKPPLELRRPAEYYQALHLERIGQIETSRKAFRVILESYPETRWAELAESHLNIELK